MVNFDFVDVYRGLGWKKKYHAPTDHCFALKVIIRGGGIKKGVGGGTERGKGRILMGEAKGRRGDWFGCQGLDWKKKDYAPMDHCFALG